MAPPKTAGRLIAEELCAKYPDHSNLGLAKKLRAENPECFSSVDSARVVVRLIRGAMGNKRKSEATQPRPKGKAGTIPKQPPSLAEAWLPFDLGSDITVGVISDTHIPYHSEVAFYSAVNTLKKRKPNVLLINGDFADFYQISRWQKNPKQRRFSEERKAIIQGLEWLRSEFGRDCRIVYKLGNHEERWNHFIWNRAPEIYDLPSVTIDSLLDFARLGIELVEDQRIILAGKLAIAHGHELGRGIFSPVNPARGAFLRTHHTILVGHSHQTSGHADTNLWHDETFVWSTGCLCDLTPEYARVNRWNHGFACVSVHKDSSFDVQNMRINRAGEVRSA
jgi:predicted phosphodiesterase